MYLKLFEDMDQMSKKHIFLLLLHWNEADDVIMLDTNSYFYILLLELNDRWRFQMKKVIQSKIAAVLILTTFADFDHFSPVNHS